MNARSKLDSIFSSTFFDFFASASESGSVSRMMGLMVMVEAINKMRRLLEVLMGSFAGMENGAREGAHGQIQLDRDARSRRKEGGA